MRQIPNILCIVRLALTPVCVWALISGEYLRALIVFFIAGWTDFFDGYLARRMNWQSAAGAYLDPIADKALMAGTYIGFGISGLVPWWLVALIFGRDAMILGGAAIIYGKTRRTKFPPRWLGKISTVLQLGAAVAVLCAAAKLVAPWWIDIGVWTCAAGTIISGGDYVQVGWRMMRQSDAQ